MLNLGNASAKDFALGQNLVERIDFGSNVVFDPYTNITGNLPLQFNSRVTANLKTYRLYGTSEGAGVACGSGEPEGYKIPLTNTSGVTENELDPDNANIINGYIGKTIIAGISYRTCYIKCNQNATYTAKGFVEHSRFYVAYTYELPQIGVSVYDAINASYSRTATITTDGNAQYLCVYYYNPNDATYTADEVLHGIVIVSGSTAPDHYIPHRYTADYNLYIGSTKLGAEEYVDYASGKIYRTIGLITSDGKDFITADNNRFCVRRNNNG